MTDDNLLTSTQVRARYGGISHMTLHRWQRDERMSFPKPLYINRLRYWRVRDLTEWEKARAREAA